MLTTGLKRSDLLQEVQCAVEKSVLVIACVLNELMCYYYYVFPCLLTYIPTWHTMTSPQRRRLETNHLRNKAVVDSRLRPLRSVKMRKHRQPDRDTR